MISLMLDGNGNLGGIWYDRDKSSAGPQKEELRAAMSAHCASLARHVLIGGYVDSGLLCPVCVAFQCS